MSLIAACRIVVVGKGGWACGRNCVRDCDWDWDCDWDCDWDWGICWLWDFNWIECELNACVVVDVFVAAWLASSNVVLLGAKLFVKIFNALLLLLLLLWLLILLWLFVGNVDKEAGGGGGGGSAASKSWVWVCWFSRCSLLTPVTCGFKKKKKY